MTTVDHIHSLNGVIAKYNVEVDLSTRKLKVLEKNFKVFNVLDKNGEFNIRFGPEFPMIDFIMDIRDEARYLSNDGMQYAMCIAKTIMDIIFPDILSSIGPNPFSKLMTRLEEEEIKNPRPRHLYCQRLMQRRNTNGIHALVK